MSHSSEKSEVSYIYILPSDGRGWTNNSSWLLYYIGKNHSIFIRERQSKSPWRYSYLYTIYTHTHVYIYVYIYFGLRFIRSPMSSLSLSLSISIYTHVEFNLSVLLISFFLQYIFWLFGLDKQSTRPSARIQSNAELRTAPCPALLSTDCVCIHCGASNSRSIEEEKENK